MSTWEGRFSNKTTMNYPTSMGSCPAWQMNRWVILGLSGGAAIKHKAQRPI